LVDRDSIMPMKGFSYAMIGVFAFGLLATAVGSARAVMGL